MNNLHLRYKLDTGKDADPEVFPKREINLGDEDIVIYPIEYVEWLERELELLLDGSLKG